MRKTTFLLTFFAIIGGFVLIAILLTYPVFGHDGSGTSLTHNHIGTVPTHTHYYHGTDTSGWVKRNSNLDMHGNHGSGSVFYEPHKKEISNPSDNIRTETISHNHSQWHSHTGYHNHYHEFNHTHSVNVKDFENLSNFEENTASNSWYVLTHPHDIDLHQSGGDHSNALTVSDQYPLPTGVDVKPEGDPTNTVSPRSVGVGSTVTGQGLAETVDTINTITPVSTEPVAYVRSEPILPSLKITHVKLRDKPYTLFIYVQNASKSFVDNP